MALFGVCDCLYLCVSFFVFVFKLDFPPKFRVIFEKCRRLKVICGKVVAARHLHRCYASSFRSFSCYQTNS